MLCAGLAVLLACCTGAVSAGAGPSARDALAAPLLRSGTAFFVTANGLMLTSAHTVAGCRRIEVWPSAGPALAASIRALDAKLDVALLATAPGTAQASARWGTPAPLHASVDTIGFGLTPSTPRVAVLTHGVLEGATQIDAQTRLVIAARLYAGNSGGPVLDRGGVVQGLVIGRYRDDPERAVLAPAAALLAFLRAEGVDVRRLSHANGKAATNNARLRQIAALVQCDDEANPP